MATVIRWGSRAPLPPSAAANTTACACASTQLLTCLRHQATWMPKTCFPPPLSTSVDGVALFAILEQENADNHPLRIHLTRSLSSQIELPTISATPLRTQRTPTSTFFPSQSPGLPFSSPTSAIPSATTPSSWSGHPRRYQAVVTSVRDSPCYPVAHALAILPCA